MKKTLFIIIIMAVAIIGIASIQVISLYKSYLIQKEDMINKVKLVTSNINEDFFTYLTLDSLEIEKRITLNLDSNFNFNSNFNKTDSNQYNYFFNETFNKIENSSFIDIKKTIHSTIDIIFDALPINILKIKKEDVDVKKIATAITNQLNKEGINNYKFKIKVRDTVIFNSSFNSLKKGYLIRETIGKGISKDIVLEITILDFKLSILNEMKWTLFPPIFLLLLTLISYWLIVKSLLMQKKINEIKNDFVDNITHELKTPISTVSLAIEALQNFDALKDKNKTDRYLEISKKATERLNTLVNKILSIAKYDQTKIELKKKGFNIIELLQEIIDNTELKIQTSGGKIQLISEFANVHLIADKEHITNVFYTILDNAIKYTNKKLAITIEIYPKNNHLIEIVFTDNGSGISKVHLSKIFEKFYRVPNKNIHTVKGFGLGLSYAKNIIEAHNGTIEVVSELNKGSKFIITLPK